MLALAIVFGTLLFYLTGFVLMTREVNRWRAKQVAAESYRNHAPDPEDFSPVSGKRDYGMLLESSAAYGAWWFISIVSITIMWFVRRIGSTYKDRGRVWRLLNPQVKLPKEIPAAELQARIAELERELGIHG